MKKENFPVCTGIARPDELAATWSGGIVCPQNNHSEQPKPV